MMKPSPNGKRDPEFSELLEGSETLPPGDGETLYASPQPGRLLGRYRVVKELGRGGMAVVYLAHDVELDRDVALKVMIGVGKSPEEQRIRFRAEAQAMASLKHPHIIRVFDVGRAREFDFFSMEYVEGRTLAELFEEGIPIRKLLKIIVKVSRAVQHAHENGIVHRDLKPGNIMVVEDTGEPLVMDFGLAMRREPDGQTGRLTQEGTAVGTPCYMSPEQAEGEREKVGPLSDVYSLGAILYEGATGKPPFEGATPLEVIMKVIAKEPVRPRRLNARLHVDAETIILKAMEKISSRRYASAAELADDAERFLESEPIIARRIGPVSRLGRRIQKRKLVSALLGLSVISILGGGGTGFYVVYTSRVEKALAEAKERDRVDRETKARETFDRARQELGEGKIEEALALFQEATHIQPELEIPREDIVRAYIQRAEYLKNRGRLEEALQATERGLPFSSRLPELFAIRANLKWRLGNTEEGIAEIEKAIALDPDNWNYHKDRIDWFAELDRWEEVVAALTDMIPRAPVNIREDLVRWKIMAETKIQVKKGSLESAARFKKIVAELVAVDKPVYAAPIAKKRLKEHEETLRDDPDDAKVLLEKGLLLESLGRYGEALMVYEKIVALQPNNAKAPTCRGELRLLEKNE
ncbi:MAG: protein kinase domain-containing protein, partial [Planctomycetota bacterium]